MLGDSDGDSFSEEVEEKEEDSVSEVDMAEEIEDETASEEGDLRDSLGENISAITNKGRSESGNLKQGERSGFPGDARSQQIENDTEVAISISSDENDASPLKSKTIKLRKVFVSMI